MDDGADEPAAQPRRPSAQPPEREDRLLDRILGLLGTAENAQRNASEQGQMGLDEAAEVGLFSRWVRSRCTLGDAGDGRHGGDGGIAVSVGTADRGRLSAASNDGKHGSISGRARRSGRDGGREPEGSCGMRRRRERAPCGAEQETASLRSGGDGVARGAPGGGERGPRPERVRSTRSAVDSPPGRGRTKRPSAGRSSHGSRVERARRAGSRGGPTDEIGSRPDRARRRHGRRRRRSRRELRGRPGRRRCWGWRCGRCWCRCRGLRRHGPRWHGARAHAAPRLRRPPNDRVRRVRPSFRGREARRPRRASRAGRRPTDPAGAGRRGGFVDFSPTCLARPASAASPASPTRSVVSWPIRSSCCDGPGSIPAHSFSHSVHPLPICSTRSTRVWQSNDTQARQGAGPCGRGDRRGREVGSDLIEDPWELGRDGRHGGIRARGPPRRRSLVSGARGDGSRTPCLRRERAGRTTRTTRRAWIAEIWEAGNGK